MRFELRTLPTIRAGNSDSTWIRCPEDTSHWPDGYAPHLEHHCRTKTRWSGSLPLGLTLRKADATLFERCADRYPDLKTARMVCERTSWCAGVTQDGGIACNEPEKFFSSGSVPLHSVCIQQGQLRRQGQSRARSHNMKTVDFGGEHKYEVQDRQETRAAPHMDLAVVAWFSCEGNLNHLVGETLVPVWEQLQRLRPATPPRLIIVAGSSWPVDSKDPQTCHSERYAYIASLLPVQPHVLFVGGARSRTLATAYDLRTRLPVAAPRHECYNTTVQVEPSFKSSTGSQDFYAAVVRSQCSKPASLDVLVVERNRTRRMINQLELLETLRALPGVDAARAVDLAKLDAAAQLRTVCAHRIMIGVHGQGMEWGHALNGVDPSGSALIEFRAGAWPCYYAQRMAGSGMISECQEHTAVDGDSGSTTKTTTAKDKDVQVDLKKFACVAKRMLCRLNPNAYHIPNNNDKVALKHACYAACPRTTLHTYKHAGNSTAPATSTWTKAASVHKPRSLASSPASRVGFSPSHRSAVARPNSSLPAVEPSAPSRSRTAPLYAPRTAPQHRAYGKKITAFALLYVPALASAAIVMLVVLACCAFVPSTKRK